MASNDIYKTAKLFLTANSRQTIWVFLLITCSRHFSFWLLCNFWHVIRVLHRICCIPAKFGENWSDSDELATVFRNQIWQQQPSWILIIGLISDSTNAFYIEFATSPPSLMWLGQIVKKLRTFFKIKDGGSRHLEFCQMCVFDMTVAFCNRFATFILNLVRIGTVLK